MISVVCVYNDMGIYNEYLLSSIQRQNGDHELIAMDNRDGYFKSAAQALNDGGRRAKGDYIMFVHQDVQLKRDDWLNRAEEMLKSLGGFGIAGVAGRKDRSGVITVITHGSPPKLAGSIQLSEPVKVQTVDECLFFVPREIFATVNMDEQTCKDWHLYAVDYSLSIQERGLAAYVLPLEAYHAYPGYSVSRGLLPEEYVSTLRRIITKHKSHYSTIYTTCGIWSIVFPFSVYAIYLRLRQRIREFLAGSTCQEK
jgi:hypothetical protein